MAFTAKILSWHFRHLNIVGCLLKRRPTKGGSRAPQDPPPRLATPVEKPVSAKGEQKKQVRQLWCQKQCIVHIPYYLLGLLHAHLFQQPFSN